MSRPLPRTAVVAAALAIVNGGYLVIDSIHRFVLGDFFRIGGQVGPWAGLVGAVGIDPFAMGPVFLIIGVAQVVVAVLLLLRRREGTSSSSHSRSGPCGTSSSARFRLCSRSR